MQSKQDATSREYKPIHGGYQGSALTRLGKNDTLFGFPVFMKLELPPEPERHLVFHRHNPFAFTYGTKASAQEKPV